MLEPVRYLKIFIVAILGMVMVGICLLNAPPSMNCRSEISADQKEFLVPARETVVMPWKGRHQVYGMFEIPEQYKYDHLYSAKLRIQGFDTEFTAGSSEDEDFSVVVAKSGYYAKRVYVSTRTALWFLLTGRFGNLRTSCHWWLVLKDKGWKPTEK